MYWVLSESELTWNSTSWSKSIELRSHSWIAAAGRTTACSTSKISRQLWHLTTGRRRQWHHLLYKKDPAQSNWKIVLPKSMVVETIKWFHQVMGYPGEKRLCETLNQCYHHPKLCYPIDRLKCKDCQEYKLTGRAYGLLPSTLDRSCHQFDWTVEGQSQWSTSWV